MMPSDYCKPRYLSPKTAEDDVVMEEARPGRIEWPFQIEFFAQETIGFTIGNVSGLARVDFE